MAGHALIGLTHLTADSVMAAVLMFRTFGSHPLDWKEKVYCSASAKRLGLHRSYSKAKKTSPWLDRLRASMTTSGHLL